jgi:ABC-type multidrug transport system permease subunit
MKRITIVISLISIMVLLSACAAGPNELRNTPDEDGEVAGFWKGIWHGLISPITFIISLFSKSVYVYEVHNNGGWYTFGFLLGASIIFGGSGGGAANRRKKYK